MSLRSQRYRFHSLAIRFVSRCLALFILSSFAATILPIATAAADHSSMPCCAGKSPEHCDSGLSAPKPRPVITEPMCGLDHASLLTAETTSQNADAQSNSSLSTAESVSQPCRMDCGTCAPATSRHKREKGLIHSRTTQTSPTISAARYDSWASVFSSNETWNRTAPRGPPASFLSF